MKKYALLLLILISLASFGQQTKVKGMVWDAVNNQPMPFVKVQFQNSKIGTLTDTLGQFYIETYYATDSLVFSSVGYMTYTHKIIKDQEQEITVRMSNRLNEMEEVKVLPPDEFPSTTLHKRVIANKYINNKEKLLSYEYELYNKIQLDLNNIGDKFTDRDIVKRLDLVMEYLDSSDNGTNYLPVILSESISKFYFKNNPKKRKEIVSATRITGIDNLQMNQFLGDMYLDINVYDNTINLFNKSFVSPVSNFARSYYRFYLEDSAFIDNQWCYKLKFKPKRTGDATFEGEMWIHDTTYAVKQISANISPGANINYIQDLYFEHHFDQVANEVWNAVIRQVIVAGLVYKDIETYGTLKLSDEGKAFLANPQSFSLIKEHDFSNTDDDEAGITLGGKGGAFDDVLYDLLVDLRKSISKQKNIPPFVIFQEPSLKDMCFQYPITMDELTNIQGVGTGKATRYGAPFLALIQKYVEENDIERPQDMVVKSLVNKSGLKVQLIQNIDRKLPLEDIGRAQGKSIDEVIEEIEAIVSSGTRVNINYYIDDILDADNQEEIYEYFSEVETDEIAQAYEEFDGDYTEEELRLMRIKFMSEMAN